MSTVMALKLSVDPSGDLLDATRACEAAVFGEAFGNTAEEWAEEYSQYEAATSFICVSEPGGDVLGAIRLVLPSDAGLKSLDDTARDPWRIDGYASARAAGLDLSTTVDVATIGVDRQRRNLVPFATAALYHALGQVCLRNGLPNAVMIMDEVARGLFTAMGCLTQVLPGTRTAPYLGSPASTPVWLNVPNMVDNMRRLNPDAYRLVYQGIGLDNVELPGPDGYLIKRLRSVPAEPVLELA